ncbi:hypothetical protein Trydic_g5596 [Trypoxylus dichotomus]
MVKSETPKQQKPTLKIQSEQKQINQKNKNKRKSLPASLINGDNENSPKKPKIDPFLGTNDLFKDEGEKPKIKVKHAKKNVKDQSGKPGAEDESNNTQKQSKTTNSKSAPEDSLGKRAQRLKERSGDETAVNYLKERILAISQNKDLTSSARRKLKLFRNTLKAGGVDVSVFEKGSVKNEAAQVVKEEKKEAKKKLEDEDDDGLEDEEEEGSEDDEEEGSEDDEAEGSEDEEEEESENEEGIGKPESKITKEEESSEDEDEEAEEEESEDDEAKRGENSNSLIDPESIEDEGSEEEDEENDEDDSEDEDDKDSDESATHDEVPSKKAKTDKKLPAKASQNQPTDTVSALKNKSRYVLFVGNLPYNVTKEDIQQHFAKIGKIKDIRIPLDKATNKCRGFGYLELLDQTSYEKALSLHHSSLKGRRINVLYSQGGKKQGDEKKKEIKGKNFKLHAMRQEGKLSGSVKQTQKRAARREKKRNANKAN